MGALRRQLDEAEQKLAELGVQLTEVTEQVNVQQERVGLLRRLVELDGGAVGESTRARSTVEQPPDAPQPPSPARLEDVVVSILSERQESVHIAEIRSSLLKRGIRIPGKGTDSNIIARIIREPRIERERGRRGYYRLSNA